MERFFYDFYDELVNDFVNIPLNSFLIQRPVNNSTHNIETTTSNNLGIDDALRINQRVVDRVLDLRRAIERRRTENEYRENNRQNNNFLNHILYFNQNGFFINDNSDDQNRNNFNDIDYNWLNDNNRSFDENSYYLSLYNNFRNAFLNVYDDLNLENLEDIKIHLNEDEFKKLKNIKITDENINLYKESSCNVCLCEYNTDDSLILLPCKHYFHEDCISNWLCKENVKCPICRKDCRESI